MTVLETIVVTVLYCCWADSEKKCLYFFWIKRTDLFFLKLRHCEKAPNLKTFVSFSEKLNFGNDRSSHKHLLIKLHFIVSISSRNGIFFLLKIPTKLFVNEKSDFWLLHLAGSMCLKILELRNKSKKRGENEKKGSGELRRRVSLLRPKAE